MSLSASKIKLASPSVVAVSLTVEEETIRLFVGDLIVFAINAPLALISPLTSSAVAGEFVPIPTLAVLKYTVFRSII